MTAFVHHYTSEKNALPLILQSGYLHPSQPRSPNEKLVVWFSHNQIFEVTSHVANDCRRLGYHEYFKNYGFVRFSLPADDPRLMIWPDACKYVGIGCTERRQMEIRGHKWGGSHTDWMAIGGVVLLKELRLQRFNGEAWVDMESVCDEIDTLSEALI